LCLGGYCCWGEGDAVVPFSSSGHHYPPARVCRLIHVDNVAPVPNGAQVPFSQRHTATIPHVDNDTDARYNQAVADILRKRKDDMGISFDALAAASGLPRSTVSRVIYGNRDIKVYALRRIAAVLELDVSKVLDDAATKL
jgi:hypothetical protein